MDRRAFIVGAVAALAAPLVGEAQQATKVYRLGYLSSNPPATFRIDVFRQALHDFGWVEGRNLVIDYRSADGKLDRLPALAGAEGRPEEGELKLTL